MQTASFNKRSRYLYPLLLLVLMGVFVVMLSHLFVQRFGVGDIYPRYSSLRTDNLGVKIISDSLEKAGYMVSRNFQQMQKIAVEPASTLFLIGIPDGKFSHFFQSDSYEPLLLMSEKGSRLVVTMLPERTKTKEEPCPDEENVDDQAVCEPGEKKEDQDAGTPEKDEAENTTEVLLGNFEKRSFEGKYFQTTARGMLGDHAVAIPWYSSAYFSDLSPDWHVILTIDGQPVLVEREWGKGSLVLATDSHFLSNEAIWQGHDPYFLTWLQGGNAAAIFDEAHHGIRQQVSVGRLIRDFDLHWILIALMVPALLFVIRCSSPLLPPISVSKTMRVREAGRDQFTGFVNILKKNTPENLLQTCIYYWCKANQDWCDKNPDRVSEIKQIAQSTAPDDPVGKYKAIARMVHRRHPTY